MKLGEIVTDIEFSEKERERLSASFRDKSGAPFEVLSKHYNDVKENSFWNYVHKLMKINGYRPGNAKDIVYRRCLDSVNGSDPKANHVLFRLYRRCVTHFMNAKSKKLDELLASEDLKPGVQPTTSQLFKEIVRLAPLYHVSPEEIRYFYDIWGFERLENFDQLNENKGLDIEVIRRFVSQELNSNNEKLREEVNARLSQEAIGTEEFEKSIANINSQIISLSQKIDTSVSVVRTELQNYTALTVDKKISQVSADLKKVSSGLSKQPTNNSALGMGDEVLRMNELLGSLGKRLVALEKSGLVASTKASEVKVQILDREPAFQSKLKNWIDVLSKSKIENYELFAVTLISSLKSNTFSIVDRFDLIEPLVKMLYQQDQIKYMVPNPLWLDSSHCEKAFEFFIDSEGSDKIIVIQDFDIPLQELYLIPALVAWRVRNPNSQNRVILVKSGDYNPIATRLFNLAALMPSLDFKFSEHLDGKGFSKLPDNAIESMLTQGLIVPKKESFQNAIEETINAIARSSDLSVSPGVISTFSLLVTNLKLAIDEDVAFRIAMRLTILNWIEKTSGEVRMRLLEERILKVMTMGSTK